MKRETETKFYVFFQNNSGGYFIRNEFVDEVLAIESVNEEEACRKMYQITEEYSEFCSCCGMRWDAWDINSYDKETDIEETNVIIYYVDGNKKTYNKLEEK